MKKTVVNNIARKFFAGNILAAVLFLSVQANAATTHINNNKEGDNKVQVKYTGSSDDALIFTVKYDNPSGNKFDISFVDENGEVIYQDTFRDKNFVKRFSVPKSEYKKLAIIVKGQNDTAEQKFDIKIESRQVENVTIAKL